MTQPRKRKMRWQYAVTFLACSVLAPYECRAQTVPGVEVWTTADLGDLAGKRIGLITNHTGRTRSGESTIDVLKRDTRVRLSALFAVEHGLRGTADAGERVTSGTDEKTGLPIYTLYNSEGNYRPTFAMLREVDALVFDIQDIGTRYYTYLWNMIMALEVAAEQRKTFVVLDRPNPISGAIVQGRNRERRDHVGLLPVSMRHGMTAGEMANWANRAFRIGADLRVIKMQGYTRGMWWEDTGIPWVAPSPNMPSVESATHYPGICLFEGTNLSVGRGTPEAFQHIGAPWLNAEAIVRTLNARSLPGVRFEAVRFTPRNAGDNKYNDRAVNGIRLVTTNRKTYDPTKAAIHILTEIQRLHADSLQFRIAHFDRLAGSKMVREQILAGATPRAITADWDAQAAAFQRERAPYLLYK